MTFFNSGLTHMISNNIVIFALPFSSGIKDFAFNLVSSFDGMCGR